MCLPVKLKNQLALVNLLFCYVFFLKENKIIISPVDLCVYPSCVGSEEILNPQLLQQTLAGADQKSHLHSTRLLTGSRQQLLQLVAQKVA